MTSCGGGRLGAAGRRARRDDRVRRDRAEAPDWLAEQGVRLAVVREPALGRAVGEWEITASGTAQAPPRRI